MLFEGSAVQRSILARSYGGRPHLTASGDMLAYMETRSSLSSGRYNDSLRRVPDFSVTEEPRVFSSVVSEMLDVRLGLHCLLQCFCHGNFQSIRIYANS